ncbi:hypothetical protein HU200_017726 [Digitaria exilis]|uniref:Bromodomain associated domain-containing protein n=1 Tax=Digitaria exilis TaxID=1010633 RepID=A0A835F6J5_9POAL|nr:hypothetical protein HU200_017726 [Digitaria exilis]CAB3450782.1 unnamed protein product [Digitaria exilis]
MGTPAKRPFDAAAASPIPRRFQAAVSAVSTAQILRASGYSAAEAAALRALSDVAGRYIESLGRAAAAFAEAHGRTEPNVADVVLALEEHALDGFPGASDPARPVLCSGALAELARFVDAVTEVPFAKPLPRRAPGSGARKGWESFAAAEREPPLRHVPHWLPRFPEGWEERFHGRGEATAKDEDTGEVAVKGSESFAAAHREPQLRHDPHWRPRFAEGWEERLRLRGRDETAAKDEEDTGEVVTVMANGNLVENGRSSVPENREKVLFRLGDKWRRRRQALPPEKCGGALELFVKRTEKLV